jgi:NTP pyrophosphatase (non-canonical NTP hydrolase)
MPSDDTLEDSRNDAIRNDTPNSAADDAIRSAAANATNDATDWSRSVREFCEARDWDRFHAPKDLAIGLVTEASELLELFRFRDDTECARLLATPEGREAASDEIADVLFFVLRFCDRNGIDPGQALAAKLAKNEKRYPAEKARGRNVKYTEL